MIHMESSLYVFILVMCQQALLLAIGTGNGNMTISNTKHSSPKGPLKKLIQELSKYCIVILVPEHNTSQLCCLCDEYLEDVEVYRLPSKKKHHCKTEDEKKIENDKISETKINKHEVRKIKKQIKNEINKGNQKLATKLLIRKETLENKTKELGYYGSSYRLRRCAAKHTIKPSGKTNQRILWERNVNASKNIIKIFRNLILKGNMGNFSKKRPIKQKHGKSKSSMNKLCTDTKLLSLLCA